MKKKYRARQSYRGTYGEQALDFVKRRVYELDEEVAAWVNRDRPGTLVERPARKAKAASNRQETGGQNRRLDRQGDPGDEGVIDRAVFGAVKD